MSPCAHIHTHVCMHVCVCGLAGFLCVCMEASNDIDMENVVYGTVRDYRYVLKCLFTRLQFVALYLTSCMYVYNLAKIFQQFCGIC